MGGDGGRDVSPRGLTDSVVGYVGHQGGVSSGGGVPRRVLDVRNIVESSQAANLCEGGGTEVCSG